jgi:hypothetical protein
MEKFLHANSYKYGGGVNLCRLQLANLSAWNL